MLIAYILSKSRHLRFKLVRGKDSGVFTKGDFEYVIDRKKIYTKRIFAIKTIFWSMYLEGVRNPIEFDDKNYTIAQTDIPLDEMAILLKKLKGSFEKIILLIMAFNIILTLLILMQLNGMV